MDLLQKITQDWFEQFNTEIRRGKYPETKLNVDWFTAVDGCGTTARDREGSKLAQSALKGIQAKNIWQAINDIP